MKDTLKIDDELDDEFAQWEQAGDEDFLEFIAYVEDETRES